MNNTLSSKRTSDPATLSRADLHVLYRTGRCYSTGYGREKTTRFVAGFLTKIGDIEEDEWFRLAEALVARENGEEELQKYIKEAEEYCAWLRTEPERRQYALQIYMRKGETSG